MQQQLTVGTFLHGGTYKIEEVLGQGSFGITYLAEHTNLGKKVAIKEFFMKELNSRGDNGSITGMTDGSLSHNYCVKFQKEAINLSRLDHPNIVRVTDSFSENGTFYYVMDYIEGQNLNDYVKSHHIDEAEAVNVIKSVADALIYMHEKKHMLHLDLKPGNVMRRESDGHIFLIDFGLSKHFDGNGQPETSTTIGLGTAGYAPIEQGNRAKNGEFRPTIDVYALGATLYKLLTRETPPPASDLVSDEDLLEDNLRAKGVSANLVKLVSEAMCPSVKKRTQTIRDFKGNLDGVKANTPNENVAEIDKDKTIVNSVKEESSKLKTPGPNVSDETIMTIENSEAEELYTYAMGYYDDCEYDISFHLLKQAADLGHAKAQYRVGVCLYWGEGQKDKSCKRVAEYIQKSANQGNTDAMLWLGSILYSNGEGVEKDDYKGFEWTKKAADGGNNAAKIYLGILYMSGTGVEADTFKGLQLITAGVRSLMNTKRDLSREEMYSIGLCLNFGIGVDENPTEAMKWLKKAAKKGDPEAMNKIGEIYLNGNDAIAEDEAKAIEWFRKAVENSSLTSALLNLGNCYRYGWGTYSDCQEALKWYKKAVEEKSDDAMVEIGFMYKNGEGVDKDYKTAADWFNKAIYTTNNADAQNALGLLYDEGGYGIDKNQVVATSWFKKAANQGLAIAQYNYGLSLLNGNGVAQDAEEGIEWVQKAADQGNEQAKEFLEKLDNENEEHDTSNTNSEPSPNTIYEAPNGVGFFVGDEYVNTKNKSVSLNTVNGWGTTFKGHYREVEGTYVAYQFLCAFFLPIIPIGCYRVKDAGVDSYNVYGSTEWHASEVIMVYLKWWIGAIALITFFWIMDAINNNN